ncbi:hypothetical protein ACIO13_10220 [Streptomyces sp. NPDC087425]
MACAAKGVAGNAAVGPAGSSATGPPAAGSSGTGRAAGSAGRSCRGSRAGSGREGRPIGRAGIRSAGSVAATVGPTDERAASNSRRVTFSNSASLKPRSPRSVEAPRLRDPVLIARVALKVPLSVSARS